MALKLVTPSLTFIQKQGIYARFSWNAITGATAYKITTSQYSVWTGNDKTTTYTYASDITNADVEFAYFTDNYPVYFCIQAIGDGVSYTDSDVSSKVEVVNNYTNDATPSLIYNVASTTKRKCVFAQSFSGKTAIKYRLSRESTIKTAERTRVLTSNESVTEITGGNFAVFFFNDPYNLAMYSLSLFGINENVSTNALETYYGRGGMLNVSTGLATIKGNLTDLDVPDNLNASLITNSSATLTWDSVPNASSYEITYIPFGGSRITRTSSLNSIVLTELLPGTAYSWSVTAIGDYATYMDSNASDYASFTTTSVIQLPPPPHLTTSHVTSNSARVHWESVENAVDYKVEYRQYGQTNWIEHQS